jgi:hypothetical protein
MYILRVISRNVCTYVCGKWLVTDFVCARLSGSVCLLPAVSSTHYTFCEYKGVLYFFTCFSYLGTKLCSAVGRTLGCAATISSAPRARRPAVRRLCVVTCNLKTVASGLVWRPPRGVGTECSNCRCLRDWGGCQGHNVLHETSYHLCCGRDVHTYRFVCLGNDSMVD